MPKTPSASAFDLYVSKPGGHFVMKVPDKFSIDEVRSKFHSEKGLEMHVKVQIVVTGNSLERLDFSMIAIDDPQLGDLKDYNVNLPPRDHYLLLGYFKSPIH